MLKLNNENQRNQGTINQNVKIMLIKKCLEGSELQYGDQFIQHTTVTD